MLCYAKGSNHLRAHIHFILIFSLSYHIFLPVVSSFLLFIIPVLISQLIPVFMILTATEFSFPFLFLVLTVTVLVLYSCNLSNCIIFGLVLSCFHFYLVFICHIISDIFTQ